MRLKINAKCSDLFSADLIGNDGRILKEYRGYVPKLMPGEHYGDYVELDIELETGKILNWVKPTKEQIMEFIGFESDDE